MDLRTVRTVRCHKFSAWIPNYSREEMTVEVVGRADDGVESVLSGNDQPWVMTTSHAVALMHALVQNAPFRRQAVLVPHLLDVDQRTLPLAEQQVLEPRKGQQLVFGIHASTPPPVLPADVPRVAASAAPPVPAAASP